MTTPTENTEDNLNGRLRELIRCVTEEYRRFKQLETMTEIQADTWKSWFHGRQRPTVDMIEAVCKRWPEHAFWITTGLTDEVCGHVGIASRKDPILEQMSMWSEKTLPYANALFCEVLDLKREINKRRAGQGDWGISSAEKIRLLGTEEMRLKETEHQISKIRQSRREDEYRDKENEYPTSLPDFKNRENKIDGNQKK